jgi:predicted DCC family thiol-disulfide oxidoreductase YuxK
MKSYVANPIHEGSASRVQSAIVFFDGVCGLCNKTVDFLLREDRDGRLLYSPLQGETFEPIRKERPELASVDAIVVLYGDDSGQHLLTSSNAVLFALDQIPRFKWLAKAGYLVPRFLRDLGYRFIAAVRYRVWGKRDSCRLPTPEERARFLP